MKDENDEYNLLKKKQIEHNNIINTLTCIKKARFKSEDVFWWDSVSVSALQ